MYRRLIHLFSFVLVLGIVVGVVNGLEVKINFQQAGGEVPVGYMPDYGEIFGDQGNILNYGWNQDLQDSAIDRNHVNSGNDQRYDTFNNLQKTVNAKWEIELPNGIYELFMVCGDPGYTDQINNFDVEGVILEDPDGGDHFDEYDNVKVDVNDGRLTIQPAFGASNCKIMFVDIISIELVQAYNPIPEDGAFHEGTWLSLRWSPGDTAVSHDVYFGDNFDNVNNGIGDTFRGNQTATIFYVGFPTAPFLETLVPGTTYYWRVDEVQADGTITPGKMWKFETSNLAAHWTFDESYGTDAEDALALHDGVINKASWVPGRIRGALTFNGVDAYAAVDNFQEIVNINSFSIFCWIKGGKPRQVIVSQAEDVNLLMASGGITVDGRLTTELMQEHRPTIDDVNITDGRWHEVGVVLDRDLNEVRLYVDGKRIAEGLPRSFDPKQWFYIGRPSTSNSGVFWAGLIDEVQIYKRVLSDEEISLLFERDRYISTGYYLTDLDQEIPATIDLSKETAMAAVRAEGATDEQIENFANSLGLQVVMILEPSGIVMLELPDAVSSRIDEILEPRDADQGEDPNAALIARLELAKFVDDIRGLPDSDSLFVEIGTAIISGSADTPILMNEQFIVQFDPGLTPKDINDLISADNTVRIVEENPFTLNEYLLAVTAESQVDALAAAERYNEDPCTVYGVPNLCIIPEFRNFPRYEPNDPIFPEQWHLDNAGLNGATEDADIDAPEAWSITTGKPNILIAAIDSDFDYDHPDLEGNVWPNQGTITFGYNGGKPSSPHHGTAVVGCIGAICDNGIGVSGSCPNCTLMLLPCNPWTWKQHEAIDYAWSNGADVISCSWGYYPKIGIPINLKLAINRAAVLFGRNFLGCPVLFAATNDYTDTSDSSSPIRDFSALENAIGVSGTTDQDKFAGTGYGKYIDVLAPMSGGMCWIVTTDIAGDEGYNNRDPNAHCPEPELTERDYTCCFAGTSAACAITSGVAGLILSINENLTGLQVRYLLQDTADKIEDSVGDYNDANGFSKAATHGYGRINAFEAVRVLAPKEDGRRGGVDIFLRDNHLDWGNTERPSNRRVPEGDTISHYESNSIEVDANCVYVRVRNRGPVDANSVTVKLHWCITDTTLPNLPPDFWAQFPKDSNNTSRWKPLSAKTITKLKYSGSSVVGTHKDFAKTVFFDFTPPVLEEGFDCYLLAMVYCIDDPISADSKKTLDVDVMTPKDNNIAMLRIP